MLDYEIVVDKNESPNKCTILPLAYRTDFLILRPGRGEIIAPPTGNLLLHPDGELFNEMPDAGITRLSVIDSNWKWLQHLLGRR